MFSIKQCLAHYVCFTLSLTFAHTNTHSVAVAPRLFFFALDHMVASSFIRLLYFTDLDYKFSTSLNWVIVEIIIIIIAKYKEYIQLKLCLKCARITHISLALSLSRLVPYLSFETAFATLKGIFKCKFSLLLLPLTYIWVFFLMRRLSSWNFQFSSGVVISGIFPHWMWHRPLHCPITHFFSLSPSVARHPIIPTYGHQKW